MVTEVRAAGPVLSSPVKTDGQFQFTLAGETNVCYLIETSTNLSSPRWTPLCTSANSNTTRIITVTNPPDNQSFYRAVSVSSPVFFAAIAANGRIALGAEAVVDGYNSAVGGYDPTTNRTATGTVATNSRDTNAINVGNGHIYGTAVTGLGGTVVLVSGVGAVGDLDWNASHTGIEPGWVSDNMNVTFLANSPPDGTPVTPAVVSGNGSNITVLADGLYSMANFISNSRTKPMIVLGNAALLVTGNFVVSGSTSNAGYVSIEPGASLKLYVGGTASISGGGVVNKTGLPYNFSYFGLLGNTSFNYSGIADFIGTINAPQADFNIAGSASVYGAIICNSFTSGGASEVHYDTLLATFGCSVR